MIIHKCTFITRRAVTNFFFIMGVVQETTLPYQSIKKITPCSHPALEKSANSYCILIKIYGNNHMCDCLNVSRERNRNESQTKHVVYLTLYFQRPSLSSLLSPQTPCLVCFSTTPSLHLDPPQPLSNQASLGA